MFPVMKICAKTKKCSILQFSPELILLFSGIVNFLLKKYYDFCNIFLNFMVFTDQHTPYILISFTIFLTPRYNTSSHILHHHHLPSFCSTHDRVSHGKILGKTYLVSCICKSLRCCSLCYTYTLFVFPSHLSITGITQTQCSFLSNDMYLIPIIIGLRYGLGFSCSLP
jgi:hypothetical protein